MTEMYKILGWAGWIWLVVSTGLVALGFWIRWMQDRRKQTRGFEVIGKNEKQS